MHAVSSDKVTWTKLPEDTFYAPENYSTDDFRPGPGSLLE